VDSLKGEVDIHVKWGVYMQFQGLTQNQRTSLFLVLMFLIADLGAFATVSATDSLQEEQSVIQYTSPIFVDGLPPLMCEDGYCQRPIRMIDRGERAASEEDGWWQGYGPDLDWNGMDDRLQRVLVGYDSISPTAIIGEDGRETVAIVVDYAWHPDEAEVSSLQQILNSHSWVGEENGAWFQVLDSIDSIAVDKVPVSALMDIYVLEGVVVIEMQNVMTPFNSIASRATRSLPSDDYSASAYERDYTGAGIVVAVLDTGVDNEHRSLNDFDDVNDDPDLDATSYDDQKWLGGYDATSSASNPDGSQDPDDGQGHGTHVAGSAVGTGGSSRTEMGTGPGAYLVDIKVLSDAGGTNSQSSLNGIQWMINNVDKDWGNNGTGRGIQIGSMSFGSISSPLNPGDEGDNGTGSEARLVNNATEVGIVCVVAMGNDGTKRVPSPASADGAISIGAVNDRDSVNRTDDTVASYSNWGPRLSDGDDDDWDELKPDITSYGTGINSASAATGTSLPGQPTRPMADSNYESKDGTSMATPIASGVVATLLQADPSLEPQEVKDILRNSSEQKGQASESSVSNRWNDKWGFGLIDASCAIDMALQRTCTPLEGGGGPVDPPPPTGNGTGNDVNINYPNNGTWLVEGDMVRISGSIIGINASDYDEVQIKIEQHYTQGSPHELKGWTTVGGVLPDWFLDVSIKSDWVDPDEDYTLVMARALNEDGDESAVVVRWVNIGRMFLAISSPSSSESLIGNIQFEGTYDGIEPDRIEYQINNDEWNFGYQIPSEDSSNQWSLNWDSTQVDDGAHRISFRLVNESGVNSDSVRRTYNVDNMPAQSELQFIGVVQILEQGLPVHSAVAGSLLEIDFTIANYGDLDASEILVDLTAPGSGSETYPSEVLVGTLSEGESVQLKLYWWATEQGVHDVTLTINEDDADNSNNQYTFSFIVEERPVEAMLRFMQGAVTTAPQIPMPDMLYSVNVRIDNMGQTDATDLRMRLEKRIDGLGWQEITEESILVVEGSSSSSGYSTARFHDIHSDVGYVYYRATLLGDGVEASESIHYFYTVIDEVSLGSQVRINLIENEVPLEFVGLDEGALLFTTIDGELHVRTITESMSMPGDVKLESNWGGELAVSQRDDGLVQAVWSRKTVEVDGYTYTDLAMNAISASGETTPKQSLMNPLKLSEGSYWGLAIDQYDGKMVIAGYQRDISTGGSWQDVTSIFSLTSETPDAQGSWGNPVIVLSDIDISRSKGDTLAIALGSEELHILYQEIRDDVTGVDRVGLMYTHGDSTTSSWSFQTSIGDDASLASMILEEGIDGEVIYAAWREGRGKEAKLTYTVTDRLWANDANHVSAPGMSNLEMNPTLRGVQFLFDEINAYGPVTRYGLLLQNMTLTDYSVSNILTEGFISGYAGMEFDGMILLSSASGSLTLKTLASINEGTKEVEDLPLLDTLLSYLPGDKETKMAILIGTVVSLLVFLVFMFVSVSSSSRRRELELIQSKVIDETDDSIEIMINPEKDDGPLLAIDREAEDLVVSDANVVMEEEEKQTLAESLTEKSESGEGNPRLDRRIHRKEKREQQEMFDEISKNLPPLESIINAPTDVILPDLAPLPLLEGLPPLGELPPLEGLPPLGELPPLGQLPLPPLIGIAPPQRDVSCTGCEAKFTVKDMTRKNVSCPICSQIIEF
jgi:subtilisin family serine protease